MHPIVSLGIGTFGPADVHVNSPTYGYITSTPKITWKNWDVVSFFLSLNVPIRFDTDVNAAALGELRWGGHESRFGDSVQHLAYVTVGTGVGVGIVLGELSVVGQMHPEAGHIRVPHHPADTYKGDCPFHGDCVEGLANAAAVAARCGIKPNELHTVDDSHLVWEIEAFYLAALCQALICFCSPQTIVLGGGVLQRACLFAKVRKQLLLLNNGYLQNPWADRCKRGWLRSLQQV